MHLTFFIKYYVKRFLFLLHVGKLASRFSMYFLPYAKLKKSTGQVSTRAEFREKAFPSFS